MRSVVHHRALAAILAGMRVLLLTLGTLLLPASALAFCGFYVGGADASLYNDASMVVLMREGTTTVLSMQNTYQGPPEEFALVVPVPVVIEEENVRILPQDVFDRVDRLTAPRLVEYWEVDPCRPPVRLRTMAPMVTGRPSSMMAERAGAADLGVTVEAEFAVGEYDIVVLSANQSDGLETWLRQQNYNIPAGAAPVLDPYVQLGTKFFVAKVDPARVTFADGRAVLSPLRVHYDSEQFSLPIRLGMLNSRGQQDLIVNILAKDRRFEVANYPNVTIPTNLVVEESVRGNFGNFYRALFDRVTEQNPGAVVTEYSWTATSCDPCPDQPLNPGELALLGGDVLAGMATGAAPSPAGAPASRIARMPPQASTGWTLTRMHHRYDAQGLTRDLVFREAPVIVGGRGMPDAEGHLQEKHATGGQGVNAFQGRYVMLHPWEGPVRCQNPQRGMWGGPPDGQPQQQTVTPPNPLRAAPTAASGPVDPMVSAEDRSFLAVTAAPAASPELGVLPAPRPTAVAEPEPQPQPNAQPVGPAASSGGCASCAATSSTSAPWGIGFVALALFAVWRRKR